LSLPVLPFCVGSKYQSALWSSFYCITEYALYSSA
jgi:hypothetical protein